ncbi:hypothetical protein [Anaplasma bovis]|uniref:hypothetical protein n=1 Tax=Anaplasma bovis TaxID=186733 RepID=UPI002FEEAAFA
MNSDLLNFHDHSNEHEGLFSVEDTCASKEGEISSEDVRYRALWGAVILQALVDITSNYKRTEYLVEKVKAFNWIKDMHADFVTVCHLAGYSPVYVRKKMKALTSAKASKVCE